MSDEVFHVRMPSSVRGLLISSIVLVFGVISIPLAESGMALFMVTTILGGFLGLLCVLVFGLLTLIDYADISPFRSVRMLTVSDSGITLLRKDRSVASELAWREVVDVQYTMLRHTILGSEVAREPDTLSFALTGGHTVKIPLAKIFAKEDCPIIVRLVTIHLGMFFHPIPKS